jgi:hypothetical protein
MKVLPRPPAKRNERNIWAELKEDNEDMLAERCAKPMKITRTCWKRI